MGSRLCERRGRTLGDRRGQEPSWFISLLNDLAVGSSLQLPQDALGEAEVTEVV